MQEIVDQGGWTAGNSAVIVISGTGRRVAESFEGDPEGAPLLHVEYRTTGSGNPMPSPENLRRTDQTWKVRLIEEEFQRLMFDVEDV